jgi:hypothetical protein
MSSSDVIAADVTLSADEGVSPATASQVRGAIYSHDRLMRSDMDLVFDVARRAGREPCPEWTGFFCEALTD